MSGTPTVPFGEYLNNNKGTGGSTTPLRDRDNHNPASASRFSLPGNALNGQSTDQKRLAGTTDVASTSSFVGEGKKVINGGPYVDSRNLPFPPEEGRFTSRIPKDIR
jgi:hypothetical protein